MAHLKTLLRTGRAHTKKWMLSWGSAQFSKSIIHPSKIKFFPKNKLAPGPKTTRPWHEEFPASSTLPIRRSRLTQRREQRQTCTNPIRLIPSSALAPRPDLTGNPSPSPIPNPRSRPPLSPVDWVAMAKVVDHSRFLNPCMLHLQKLGLELMCPLWSVCLISFFFYYIYMYVYLCFDCCHLDWFVFFLLVFLVWNCRRVRSSCRAIIWFAGLLSTYSC